MYRRAGEARTIGIGLLLGAAFLMANGCGSHPAVALHSGTIEVRRDVNVSSLLQGVLGVRPGSSSTDVRDTFGTPFAKTSSAFHGHPDTCWAYRAHQPDSSLDALDFCVNRAQRVDRVLIGVHG
jgi:hypothetical protein